MTRLSLKVGSLSKARSVGHPSDLLLKETHDEVSSYGYLHTRTIDDNHTVDEHERIPVPGKQGKVWR